jgi:hypothetical protein
MKVGSLLEPLSASIQVMLERPEMMMPFVIVHINDDRCVQFCGSDSAPLRFEAVISGSIMAFTFENKPAGIAEVAAAFAIQYMTETGIADLESDVTIYENPPHATAN